MIQRILRPQRPFPENAGIDPNEPWQERRQWPSGWLHHPDLPAGVPEEPFLLGFRCRFILPQPTRFRLHLSGDEHYVLYLDGVRAGEGPEAGDRLNWCYESYELELSAGEHTLAALVFALGPRKACKRASVRPGLLCATEDGPAVVQSHSGGNWEVAALRGVSFLPLADEVLCKSGWADMTGPGYALDLREWEDRWWDDNRLDWRKPLCGEPGNGGTVLYPARAVALLRPAELPAFRETRHTGWTLCGRLPEGSPLQKAPALLAGAGEVAIPAGTECAAVLDSGDYLFARSELVLSGEGEVELAWAECLRDRQGGKTRRPGPETTPEDFCGIRDRIVCGGTPDAGGAEEPRRVALPEWRAGRFLRLRMKAGSRPLVLHAVRVLNSRYPLPEAVEPPQTNDREFNQILQVCRRTQLACLRDTFMDCPYYEQLQYIGDARLQALLCACLTPDAAPARRAITLLLSSRFLTGGLPAGCHPTGGGLIPPFALWLCGMLHDFALWHDDEVFVRATLPAVRGVLEHLLAGRGADGLVRSPFGWNFLDASLGQVMPGGMPGRISGPLNWQLALALRQTAELEEFCGEPECAARWRRQAGEICSALQACFDPAANLYRDVLPGDSAAADSFPFSEHGQVLALLSGVLPPQRQKALAQALPTATGLREAGGYFTHYLFEAYRTLQRPDRLLARLGPWREALAQGFLTFPEHFSSGTRSDCHAWNAHPLFHFYTTLLGIRPAGWGFRRVRIAPQPGAMSLLSGEVPHPAGLVRVRLERTTGWQARITLPSGLPGELVWGGQTLPLQAGEQTLHLGIFPS